MVKQHHLNPVCFNVPNVSAHSYSLAIWRNMSVRIRKTSHTSAVFAKKVLRTSAHWTLIFEFTAVKNRTNVNFAPKHLLNPVRSWYTCDRMQHESRTSVRCAKRVLSTQAAWFYTWNHTAKVNRLHAKIVTNDSKRPHCWLSISSHIPPLHCISVRFVAKHSNNRVNWFSTWKTTPGTSRLLAQFVKKLLLSRAAWIHTCEFIRVKNHSLASSAIKHLHKPPRCRCIWKCILAKNNTDAPFVTNPTVNSRISTSTCYSIVKTQPTLVNGATSRSTTQHNSFIMSQKSTTNQTVAQKRLNVLFAAKNSPAHQRYYSICENTWKKANNKQQTNVNKNKTFNCSTIAIHLENWNQKH